jgi:asparagine synthase (glutamine-hydrolysing)
MVEAMHHRGPDDSGVYTDNYISFGMSRLSILDLSPAGHQPMFNEKKTIGIVFNGEIYNFQEKRRELIAKGYHFKSGTDTEVIIKLYEEYGEEFIKQLRGMFAFAIYDRRKSSSGKIIIARDHLGIKPLYYYYINDVFIFASEIKALLSSNLIPKLINPEALRLLMTFGSVLQPQTMLKNVFMLLPAHYMVIENGKVSVNKYWSMDTDRIANLRSKPYHDQVDYVRQTIEESVKMQMIGDVPVGAFLSGGVDSSLLVAIMAKSAKAKVKTFSIGFGREGSEIDETDDARKVAEHLGTIHKRVVVSEKEVRDNIRKIASSLDQPTVDGFNSYFVSKAASEGVTVAISGTGGDELFAGYPWFINMVKYAQNSRNNREEFISKLARNSLFDKFVLTRFASKIEEIRKMTGYLPQFAREYMIFGTIRASNILSDNIRRKVELGREPSIDINIADELSDKNAVDRATALCLRGYTQNQLLRDIDVASMAHSLEVRVPFLDPYVVDVALSLPIEAKLPKAVNVADATNATYRSTGAKRILIDAGRKWLPPDIDLQIKRGFSMPFDYWLKGSLKDVVEDTLSSDVVKRRGYFNPTQVASISKLFKENKMSWPSIWLLVITELWAREVLDD